MNSASDESLLASLIQSKMYRDYERAFTQGTGLPLRLRSPNASQLIRHAREQENPFCTLMATTSESSAQCYTLQQQVEKEAQLSPRTLKCFAGLCETAVPVRVGDKIIAFLQTGQVLLRPPTEANFKRITRTLLSWGAQVDLKKVEEAYFNTRVISPARYEGLVRLLMAFAEHLGECANSLTLHSEHAEPPRITKAREFIERNSQEALHLEQVAQVINMSATYFSEIFKVATGMNFVEYVARTRVEKARTLLQDPNRRISEIAFEVGFQSLSQFNRSFRKYCGQPPREYRATLHTPPES
jgi:AraC-like DNA-binding protein/ligand-binding sensor protein